MAHPVRLHPKQQVQRVLGRILEIIGPIFAGRAVQLGRADFFHGLKVVVVEILAAIEHEMLEEVRESSFAGLLVFRADVIPNVHGHDGGFVVLVHDEREPVFENKFRVGISMFLPSSSPARVRRAETARD